jgi:predicted transcriptional regulator of viral defense system
MAAKTIEQILEMVRQAGVIRPRDVDALGLPPRYLSRLYGRGSLGRTERGLYRLPGTESAENRGLVEVSKRVPRGVVCLLSALRQGLPRRQSDAPSPREPHMPVI